MGWRVRVLQLAPKHRSDKSETIQKPAETLRFSGFFQSDDPTTLFDRFEKPKTLPRGIHERRDVIRKLKVTFKTPYKKCHKEM